MRNLLYVIDKYTSNRGYWKSRIIFKESVRKMKEICPEEIQKLIDIYEPYAVGGRLADNAPQEAIEALEKVKEWDFKQGQ